MRVLFIVPWLAAPTRSGQGEASAPKHTSATRWLTSTLPAPTAAGGRAATMVPAGATIETGRMAPPLAGIVGSGGGEGPAVGGDGGSGGEGKGEAPRADRHRLDGVDVAGPLGVGAGEVE